MKKIIFHIIAFQLIFNSVQAQYIVNNAGDFNGSNSYVAIPNVPALNPVGAITLEAWVYPTVLAGTTMTIIGKNYQTSYYLGIQTSGRVVFYPRGGSSFRSRVNGVIPINKWTHIAATYDGSSSRIYINGLLDTSSSAFTGAIGVNTDSVFIGADRVGSVPSLFFRGRLDNVRMWATSRFAGVISDNRFIPLEAYAPTGYYENLRVSFQLDGDFGNYSGGGLLSGNQRGNFNFINFANKPVNYQDYNNNLVLNGTSDYFSVANHSLSGFNPTAAITLEAWIKRDTLGAQNIAQNILNKSGGTTRYDYGLIVYPSGVLGFALNSEGYFIQTPASITSSQWTHVAASYNSANGKVVVFVNGDSVAGGTFAGNPPIDNNNDNVYIGGIGASSYSNNKFKGQIDGIRIWSAARTPAQIKGNMYKGNTFEAGLTHFYFDKFTNAIYSGGARIYNANTFGGLAHVSSSHLNKNSELTSPMLYDNPGSYYSDNFTSSYKRFFVPDNGSSIRDSIFIPSGGSISNLSAYLLLSHTWVSDMSVTIVSPSGTSVNLFNHKGGSGNDLMTIFSDNADSLASPDNDINGFGVTAPFSPGIKPEQPLSILNGQNKQGWWKMIFSDNFFGQAGYVHGWGLNITGVQTKTFKLTALIQGFYNGTTDKMVKDTAKVFLRSATPPYNFLDTAKAIIDSAGKGSFIFNHITTGPVFYMVVTHRNSIETWSSGGYIFASDTLFYNFTLAASQAYQSNQIQKGNRFCIYNGDANQDGVIDATDLSMVDNDAFNFATGYISTDNDGNNFIDASDAAITDNNAFNFVSKITP